MTFDSFNICAAYHHYLVHWNFNGRTRRCEATGRGIGEQLHRLRYRPGLREQNDMLDEGAWDLYRDLVLRWEGEDVGDWPQAEEEP